MLDNSKLSISHYDDKDIFDTIFINKGYDLNFINYIVQELRKSKDIIGIFSLYDSQELEKLLENNGLKVLAYQYTIKYSKQTELEHYNISNILDQEATNFYLKIINMYTKINHEYIYSNTEYQEINENYFKNEEFRYRIYRKNGNIIGIVSYRVFESYFDYGNNNLAIFDCNNKICIRGLFSNYKQALEDIIKDLLNTYKKDIVIIITYSEKKLRHVVESFNSTFDYCQYILYDFE